LVPRRMIQGGTVRELPSRQSTRCPLGTFHTGHHSSSNQQNWKALRCRPGMEAAPLSLRHSSSRLCNSGMWCCPPAPGRCLQCTSRTWIASGKGYAYQVHTELPQQSPQGRTYPLDKRYSHLRWSSPGGLRPYVCQLGMATPQLHPPRSSSRQGILHTQSHPQHLGKNPQGTSCTSTAVADRYRYPVRNWSHLPSQQGRTCQHHRQGSRFLTSSLPASSPCACQLDTAALLPHLRRRNNLGYSRHKLWRLQEPETCLSCTWCMSQGRESLPRYQARTRSHWQRPWGTQSRHGRLYSRPARCPLLCSRRFPSRMP
jgi:hypothetical protein